MQDARSVLPEAHLYDFEQMLSSVCRDENIVISVERMVAWKKVYPEVDRTRMSASFSRSYDFSSRTDKLLSSEI